MGAEAGACKVMVGRGKGEGAGEAGGGAGAGAQNADVAEAVMGSKTWMGSRTLIEAARPCFCCPEGCLIQGLAERHGKFL